MNEHSTDQPVREIRVYETWDERLGALGDFCGRRVSVEVGLSRYAGRRTRAAVVYGTLDDFEGNDDGTFRLFFGRPPDFASMDIPELELWGHTEGEPGVELRTEALGGALYLDVRAHP